MTESDLVEVDRISSVLEMGEFSLMLNGYNEVSGRNGRIGISFILLVSYTRVRLDSVA